MIKVAASRFHETEISNMGHHMTYDAAGESLEAMREPQFFLPVKHRLNVGDLIEVFWKAEGWLTRYARLRVRRVLPDGIHTALEGMVDYEDSPEGEATPEAGEDDEDSQDPRSAKVEWAGPAHKWRIVGPDGAIIATEFESKEAAQEALDATAEPEAA